MIELELGRIAVFINGREIKYLHTTLPKCGKSFHVDGRQQIKLSDLSYGDVICELIPNPEVKIESGAEPGEGLEMISFWNESTKLSIGVEGDIEGIEYSYFCNGLRMKIEKKYRKRDLYINIAWKNASESEYDTSCWYAGDPTLK